MVQGPVKRRGIDEDEMKMKYPKTYLYLKRFEGILRERAAYKRYFTCKDRNGRTFETGPFYSMFDVGDYTFAPYKAVWRYIAADFICSVIGCVDGKPVIPNEKLMLISCESDKEAFYLCGLSNSSPSRFIVISYGIGTQLAPHILQNIRIPKFDPKNKLHLEIAKISEEAHILAKSENQEELKKIEEKIDKIAAQIWGVTDEELEEIKLSLEELK